MVEVVFERIGPRRGGETANGQGESKAETR